MPYETLTGQSEPVGEKPEILSEIIISYNDDGDPIGEGEVFYYLCQGIKYVTKYENCHKDDLYFQLSNWCFEDTSMAF